MDEKTSEKSTMHTSYCMQHNPYYFYNSVLSYTLLEYA